MAHSILVTVTLPTARKDGAPAAPSDISEVDILRATVTAGTAGPFAKIGTIPSPSTAIVTWNDATVLGGQSYEYEAFCIDRQTPPVNGDTSAPTGALSVPLALSPLGAPSVTVVLQ
jgi:hypothetical protein